MKKTIIASAIAAITLSSGAVQAGHLPYLNQIEITNMLFGSTNYAAGGTLFDDGVGIMHSIDPFFYHTWNASQATAFMDTTGSFAGSNAQGGWDYSAEIAGMSAGQIAVGIFFNWGGSNDIAVLEIFDCAIQGIDTVCTGNGVAMDNGPFVDSVATFSGIGHSVIPDVPVPAAAWLMGSGLFGLVTLARRNRLHRNT